MNPSRTLGRRRRPRATMTDREFIQWMRDQCDAQLATPPDPGEIDSPTGRKPRLLWTPDRQRCFNRMCEEGEAGDDTLGGIWYRVIKSNALGDCYGDIGTWATLMFQMTGDAEWVPHAWRQLEPMFSSALDDDNNTREYAQERVVLLDWLWPGLSEAQRTQYFDALDRMFTNADIDAVRLNDSDQTTGVYFGVLFYAHAFGDVHPKARDFMTPKCGGLDATAADLKSTLRNAVAWFVDAARGGEWLESSDYNLGTVRLLTMGYHGARTVLGADHFPEIAAWLPAAAQRYALMLTPDLAQSYQWGDEQHPRDVLGWKWSSTAMMFDDPIARKTVYDLVDALGAIGEYSAEPTVPRAFFLFDPYGPTAALTTSLLDARGQGIVSARSPQQAMLCIHFPPTPTASSVDHLVNYFGDWQLYRRNAWALTHPICYAGVGNDGRGTTGMLHRGIGAPKECRLANTVYRGDDWFFAAGTSGGTILPSKFYQPPATFWHEWSRQLLWIAGADVDTIIVFDRSHLDDPLLLPNVGKYPDDLEKKFNDHPLRLWRWHCPVAPTLSGRTATWPIGNGETARVTWQRSEVDTLVTNQADAWANLNMLASERKYHFDVIPEDDCGPFLTMITVLEFGDASAFSSIVFHVNAGDHIDAVQLSRSGRPEWAVLFNTLPGPTLPTYGGQSAYHPDIPGLLAPVRLRDHALPTIGARVWGMETASGLPMVEP